MLAALQKYQPRVLILMMSGVFLILAAAMFSGVLWPQIKLNKQTLEERTMLHRISMNTEELERQLQALSEDVDSLSHQIHGDMVDLPEKQLEAFVIGRLQGISTRNDVRLMSVQPHGGESVNIFREALFDVTITGDYFDLFNWLQDLSRELGFVVVKRYTIAPLGPQEERPMLHVSMTIVSYRRVENG
jgi:Tfp pilus assembly protein PilO